MEMKQRCGEMRSARGKIKRVRYSGIWARFLVARHHTGIDKLIGHLPSVSQCRDEVMIRQWHTTTHYLVVGSRQYTAWGFCSRMLLFGSVGRDQVFVVIHQHNKCHDNG